MISLKHAALLACFSSLGTGAFLPLDAAVEFRRGDANGDARVDLSDAVALLLHLFRGDGLVHCQDAADANDNGALEIGDAVWDLAYLFGGGAAPPPPFPAAGLDPTSDELACAEYPWASAASRCEVTIIYDNYAYAQSMRTDWGYACLVEVEGEQILVDTGKFGSILTGNITALGIDPSPIGALFLSHSHDDHVGAVDTVLDLNANIIVYAPQYFSTAVPAVAESVLSHGATLIYVTAPTEICRYCVSSGVLPGTVGEQALLVRTKHGTILIAACAHPGIVSMVESAQTQLNDAIYLVMGGFHLFQKSDAEVRQVIAALKALGVRKVAPSHCSGDRARVLFEEEYGADYLNAGVGLRFSLDAR